MLVFQLMQTSVLEDDGSQGDGFVAALGQYALFRAAIALFVIVPTWLVFMMDSQVCRTPFFATQLEGGRGGGLAL